MHICIYKYVIQHFHKNFFFFFGRYGFSSGCSVFMVSTGELAVVVSRNPGSEQLSLVWKLQYIIYTVLHIFSNFLTYFPLIYVCNRPYYSHYLFITSKLIIYFLL